MQCCAELCCGLAAGVVPCMSLDLWLQPTMCRMERQCRMCHPSGVVLRRQHGVAVSPTCSALLTTSQPLPSVSPEQVKAAKDAKKKQREAV